MPLRPFPNHTKHPRASIPWTVILRRIRHRTPAILHAITKDQRSLRSIRNTPLALVLAVMIHEDDVEGMEVTWDEPAIFCVNKLSP
jgi:hypothetical protein